MTHPVLRDGFFFLRQIIEFITTFKPLVQNTVVCNVKPLLSVS